MTFYIHVPYYNYVTMYLILYSGYCILITINEGFQRIINIRNEL